MAFWGTVQSRVPHRGAEPGSFDHRAPPTLHTTTVDQEPRAPPSADHDAERYGNPLVAKTPTPERPADRDDEASPVEETGLTV